VSVCAVELRGLHKRFGPVHANRGVSLAIPRGSIHGLVGENGAGKSTLMNLLFGLHQPDEGEILIDGRPVRLASPQAAIACGVGMVHQHFMLVEPFTVLENLLLGSEGGCVLAPGLAATRASLETLASAHGLDVPLDQPVEELSVGQRQRVEILKALHRKASILILDEPTAVLTVQEADRLFELLRHLRDEGKTLILVTHKLREIMAVTDRVTVLRQGSVVADFETRATSERALANAMVGRAVSFDHEQAPARPGATLLEVRDLVVADAQGVPRVRGLSFSLRAGEIVGIAGVSGNGQTELLEAIAGIRAPASGSIRLDTGPGGDAGSGPLPRRRRALGLAHVPEDRLGAGIVSDFSAQDNLLLGHHLRPAYRRGPFLLPSAVAASCLRLMEAFAVRPADPALRAGAFSGGNQQKLVLAREIDAAPRVLLAGQPTRGVDIGAIEDIHRRLLALRDAGVALLLVSVELDEILALSDRILVMHAGRIAGELSRAEATEQKIGLLMAGAHPSPEPPISPPSQQRPA
jgi:simple sugar transport system ATP-binding protein